MKRMKRVGTGVAMEPSSSSSPYAALYEDPKTKLKHETLMQDFHDLFKETEDQKKKLHVLKQKKSTLLAEVRFLRQRYEYLMQNRPQNPAPQPKYVQKQKNLVNGVRNVRKEKLRDRHDAAFQSSTPRFDLNKMGRIYSERKPALPNPALNQDMNQKQKRKEAAVRNSAAIPSVNQKERAVRRNTPIFDLNQISWEEEELQANNEEPMRMEEPKMCILRGGSDEQRLDMKLSACRSIGHGSSRAGKRKISWQDPVALRV